MMRRKYWTAVLVFLLLGIYTEIPLFISESLYVPSFLTVFATPILLLVHGKHIRYYDVAFITKVSLVLLLSAVLSPGAVFLAHKLTGVLQTAISLMGGVLIVLVMGRMRREELVRILFGLAALLFLGTLLEVAGYLRDLSDGFREWAYSQGGYGVYSNPERDAILTGFERPKFFTSEPSLLAIGFFAFSNSWLILAPSRRNVVLVSAGTVMMLYWTGSPILAISLGISVWIAVFNGRKNTVLMGIAMLVMILLSTGLGLLSIGLWDVLGDRFMTSFATPDLNVISSENLRILFPYLTLVDVLSNSPFFGVGISGKDMIDYYSTLPIDSGSALGNNNFTALFIYLGGIGAIAFLFTFYGYLRQFLSESKIVTLLILFIGLSQMMGAFESPRFWGYVFIFIGVLRKSDGNLIRESKSYDISQLNVQT